MCGIVTASGSIPHNTDKINLLFAYNEHRGKDSIGYYNEIDKIPFEKRVYKKMGQCSDVFIPEHHWEPSNLFIGHLRAATKGAVNLENAHPFIYGDIIGCHNGTLKNWEILKQEYNLDDDVNMDSKIFFNYFSMYNDFKILEEFEGAANVLWVDKKQPRKLFVFKHKERTLFRGLITKKKEKIMYISSTEKGLKAIGCLNIKEFKNQYLYEIVDGVIVKTTKIKSNPRTDISEERKKELNICDKEDVEIDFSPSTLSRELISKYKDGTEWISTVYKDKTEIYFPAVLESGFSHPKVCHKEILYNEDGDYYKLNIFLDSGGYIETRLGLPDFHYDRETGENIFSLLEKSNVSDLSFQSVELLISSSVLLQEIIEHLSSIKTDIYTLYGYQSMIGKDIIQKSSELEKKCEEAEFLLTQIIDENVETDLQY